MKKKAAETELDSANRFNVREGSHNTLRISTDLGGWYIGKAEAPLLAAWLIALADPKREKFDVLLKAILEG